MKRVVKIMEQTPGELEKRLSDWLSHNRSKIISFGWMRGEGSPALGIQGEYICFIVYESSGDHT